MKKISKIGLIIVYISLAIPLLAYTPNPFGEDPWLGGNYVDFRNYAHPGLDIYFSTTTWIKPFAEGKVEAIEENSLENDAEGNDWVVIIDYGELGEWTYGHLDKESIKHFDLDDPLKSHVYPGDPTWGVIGKLSVGEGNWEPHLHLEYSPDRENRANPLPQLVSMGYTCESYFHEQTFFMSESHVSLTLPIGDRDMNLDEFTVLLDGRIDLKAKIRIARYYSEDKAILISPHAIRWGIEKDGVKTQLGEFIFEGNVPSVTNGEVNGNGVGNNVSFLNNVRNDDEYIITDLTGSENEGGHNLDDVRGGFWNTKQKLGGTPDEDADCNSNAKFPDGKYTLYIEVSTYCDMGPFGPLFEASYNIYIDNYGPIIEGVGNEPDGRRRPTSGEGNNLYAYFTEPMDSTTFAGNINVKVVCHNLAEANIDSMKFSENLTELTMFLPDTFYYDEAYHVELTNDITDIAGTPLDGNANCEIDADDNYETIVGGGNCNHAFIVQTGATVSSWDTVDYYQDCLDAYSIMPYRKCGGFPLGTGERTALSLMAVPLNSASITVTGEGVVFPPNNSYVVSLGNPPADTNSYSFTVNKDGNHFTWELITSKYLIHHYSLTVWVNPYYGATWGTTIKYVGQTVAESFKHNCACDMGLFAHTDSMNYSGNQVGCDFDFITYITFQNTVFSGSNPRHPTLTPIDAEPETVGGGGSRAASYTGFSGISRINLEFGGNCTFSGGCGHSAPNSSYNYSDGSFQLPPAPDLPAPIATFDVDYGTHYEVALALGMPATVIIGQGAGVCRPNTPGDETEPHKEPELPKEFALGTPRPNPFNTSVSFDIELPEHAVVDLYIYDILGRLVDIPIYRTEIPAGRFTENWSCENCPSGVYFVRINAGDFQSVRKMTLLK